MISEIIWLFALFALYASYCLYCGLITGKMSTNAEDFFMADRRIPPWIFIIVTTAVAFSGASIMGVPTLIYRDGLSFAQIALGAILIPLTGVIFFKRQWLLGKRFGYHTPTEMFGSYFGGETIRFIILFIALVFAIPFVGMHLNVLGHLIEAVSQGAIDNILAIWVLTGLVIFYICLGGLRAVAYVGTLQGLLLVLGIICIGVLAIIMLGGFDAFSQAMSEFVSSPTTNTSNLTNDSYFKIPGVIQFTAGIGSEMPANGIWTASMLLTYTLSLMGLLASPVFTMWVFSCQNTKGFAAQQVWASAVVFGLLLVIFTVVIGMGAHFINASKIESATGLELSLELLKFDGVAQTNIISAYLVGLSRIAPWMSAFLTICVIAAIQVMVAAYAITTSVMLTRDFYLRYYKPKASDHQQIRFMRISLMLVLVCALTLTTYTPHLQIAIGSLALSFVFQLIPALLAICWFPFINRKGVLAGLIAGLIIVIFTENLGKYFVTFLHLQLPWGRWPWTIHSAVWGIAVNAPICLLVSWLSRNRQTKEEIDWRQNFHNFLSKYDSTSLEKYKLRKTAWILTLIWIFFSVGPGAVLGNDIFGAPNVGFTGWYLGIPSLWAWQILWWSLGVMLLWFLAYKMEMSTFVDHRLEFSNSIILEKIHSPVRLNWLYLFWSVTVAGMIAVAVHLIFG